MKNLKPLLALSCFALAMTACQKHVEVKPEFYNFTKADEVSLETFNAKVSERDAQYNFANYPYENSSFERKLSSDNKVETVSDFKNSSITSTVVGYKDNTTSYNARDDVYLIEKAHGETSDSPLEKISVEQKENTGYQISNGKIISFDQNKKIYKELADASSYTSFGNYVRSQLPLSSTYIADNVNYFINFAREDYPTKYYVRNGIFTTSISYESQDKSVEGSYAAKYTVKATCQINPKSDSITISTQYETVEERSNFSETYSTSYGIQYEKITITSSLLSVDTFTFGGTVRVSKVNISNFSQVQ